jgi:Flp pilus assembly protein TadG
MNMVTRFNGRRLGRLGSERGQSVLEVALMSPLLLLMLFGMVDLGRWVFQAMEVSSAARAGAQYGIQTRLTSVDNAGITAAAKNDVPDIPTLTVTPATFCQCANAMGGSGSNVLCTGTGLCSTSNIVVFVKVDTSATFQTWIPYPRIGLASSITMKGHAIMAAGQ